MSADRNLLFGMLALQMNFISRDALIAAMHAWVLDKAKPLGQILLQQGQLNPERLHLLDTLVQEHLKAHRDDPEQSLAAVTAPAEVREHLRGIADVDVQASLQIVAAPHDASPDATLPYVNRFDESRAGSRFSILRPHAKGGIGEVYVAEDQELHREVALKEIQPRYAHDPHSRSRFLMEAEITAGLEHPGIVPIYGCGQYADGRPFYAMRFIQGDTLKDAIRNFHEPIGRGAEAGERRIALRQLLERFLDVCNAVAYAHSRGVIHRDLKPANVMLGKYGETLIIDWGLAKAVGRPESEFGSNEATLKPSSGASTAATQMGSAIGTPAFMSPEQASGRLDRLGPASDVYSLGATLYVLLTGQVPFPGESGVEVMEKIRLGSWVPPAQAKKGTPRALDAMCRKAMALEPEARYATALALAADVEHWLADEPVSAYREPLKERTLRWCRRRPLVAIGVGFLTALDLSFLSVLVGAMIWRGNFLFMLPSMVIGVLIGFGGSLAIVAQVTALVGVLLGMVIAGIIGAVRGGMKNKILRAARIGGKTGAAIGVVLVAGGACAMFFSMTMLPSGDYFGAKSWILAAGGVTGLAPIFGAIIGFLKRGNWKARMGRSVRGTLVGSVVGPVLGGTLFYCSLFSRLTETMADMRASSSESPSHAPEVEMALVLGNLYHTQAESATNRKKPQDALVYYGKAITALEPLLTKQPRPAKAEQALCKSLAARAEVLAGLGRHAEALSDFERAIQLDTWPEHNELRLQRALTLARVGQHAKATAEADALAPATAMNGEKLCALARIYALAVAAYSSAPQSEGQQQLEQHASAAIKLLTEAQAADYFQIPANLDDLKANSDFDSLRTREDFKKLLAELEAKAKQPAEKASDSPKP